MSVAKFIGLVDILVAIILLTDTVSYIGKLKYVLIIILLAKSLPGLLTDNFLLRIYVITDIIVVLFLYFGHIPIIDGLRYILVSILLVKGVPSLFG